LFIGVNEGVEEVLAPLAATDAGQVGAHIAAFAPDLVAANAMDLRLVKENLPPVRGVAARKHLAVARKRSFLCPCRLVAGNPVCDRWRRALAGGLKHVEFDVRRHHSRRQPIKPLAEQRVRLWALHLADDGERALPLDCATSSSTRF